MFNKKLSIWTLFSALVLSTSIQAHEGHQFRSFKPIATANENKQALPEGARPVEQVQQLTREQVEPMIREIVEKWNTSVMSDTLSEQFYDKSRLLDTMDRSVPRDAKLRFQSIRSVQTTSQYIVTNPTEGRNEMVSIVSATVRTQLEFNNTSGSFVSRTGTNELILKITSSTNQ